MMKKVNNPITKRLFPVKLYIDDIEEILLILKSAGFSDIEVKTDKRKYDEDEINEIKSTEILSEIKSYNPFYVSISFSNDMGSDVRIYTSNDDVLACGVIEKVSKFMKLRRRNFIWIMVKSRIPLALPIPPLLVGLMVINTISFKTFIIYNAILLIYVVTSMILDSSWFFKKNIFIFKKKEEQSNFWIRNKDEIIIATFFYFMGLISAPLVKLFLG